MKPHGTVETFIGCAKQSPGVSMALSLVWLRGRLHLRIQEEPRGPTPPKRPFRCFHVRSERLPDLIARLQEADEAAGAIASLSTVEPDTGADCKHATPRLRT